MNKVILGFSTGITYAMVEVLILSPISLPNKTIVILASVLTHFSVGLLVATTDLKMSAWLKGVLLGVLITLPGAISTPSYTITILAIGVIEGLLTGILVQKLSHN